MKGGEWGGLHTCHCLYFKVSPNHCLIHCPETVCSGRVFKRCGATGEGGRGGFAPGRFVSPEPT